MRDRSKRRMIMYGLIVALALTTIGYAILQTTLNIQGSIVRQGSTWDIHFENPIVTQELGYAELALPDPFPANTTSFNFEVSLELPGDKAEFTVLVVNSGTIDATLDQIILSGKDEAAAQDVIYTLTYNDGTPISQGDELLAGYARQLKLVVEYDESVTTLTNPDDVTLKLGATLVYVQTTKAEIPDSDRPTTDDTTLVHQPNLLNNSLTPVVYDANYYGEDEGSWVVADTTKEWYNYDNQQWANAVILETGITKNVGDPITVPTADSTTSEVKAMYVWIPRYEYKIEGTYGTHTDGTAGTEALPGEIDINFIPQSQTTAHPGYILHPAFIWNVSENYDTNGNPIIEANEHLTGIWVGKFETTGTGDAPTILPNTSSLREQNVSTQFATAQKLGTYLNNTSNTDSHMMKNSEWGAVAYLSQSIYGKYGNSSYNGANKEVYMNNSSEYYTGSSSGLPPTQGESTTGTCYYDDITDRGNGTGSCGGGASTTGNIYGVYDMSGGALEYVMGYLTTAYGAGTWGGNYAGFTSAPAGRYFDAYTSEDPLTACNGGICYGHALSETSGWYNDLKLFVDSNVPWVERGGEYYYGSAGVFESMDIDNYSNGDGSQYQSFRSVLFAPGA